MPTAFLNVRFFVGFFLGFSFSVFTLKQFALQSIWRNRCHHPSQFVRYHNLSREMNAKSLVLVGIMTHYGTVETRAVAIHKTWARDVPGKVVFFVGNSDNKTEVDLPLVVLPVADDVYPPQEKAMLMLKYIYEHYADCFRWFIRADDDVYINSDNLGALLISISGGNDVLLGHPGIGTTKEKGKLGLEEQSNFCIGGTGIVMSRSVLKKVYPHLNHCIKHTATAHEDSEVGRCIKKFVGVQCPWGYEASEIFYQDYGDDQQAYHGDLDLIPIEKVVSLHPVKDARYLFRLHHHFLSIKQRERQNHARKLKKRIKNTQKILSASKRNDSTNVFRNPHMYYCKLEQCDEFHAAEERVHPRNLPPKAWAMFHDLQSFGAQQFSTPVEEIRSSKAKILKLVTEKAKQNIMDEEKLELYDGFYFGGFTVGYTRESPVRGNLYEVHYIVRMKRYVKTRDKTLVKTLRQPRRVKFKNTFGSLTAQIQQNYSKNDVINIVLPCKTPVNLFENFLKNVYDMLEKFHENLRVFVVCFRDVVQTNKKFKSIFEIYRKKFGDFKFVWLEIERKRDTFVKIILKNFSKNQLLLFTQIGFTISAEFLERCRQKTEKGTRLYFPLALKTRDKKNAYLSGRWDIENYATFCTYSDDVIALKDMHPVGNASSDTDLETSSFIDMFIAREQRMLEIFRAPDPGLLLLDSSRPPCSPKDKACADKFDSTKKLFDYIYKKDYLKDFL